MKIGISIRNMGPQSTREIITGCAVSADEAGLDSLWITEHIGYAEFDTLRCAQYGDRLRRL